MTNADLKIAYKIYNKKYFHNKLPHDMVVHFTKMEMLGATHFYGKRPCWIVINKKLRWSASLAVMTLVHEMVHVELVNVGGHGAPFQKRMLQLAKGGAFNKLW